MKYVVAFFCILGFVVTISFIGFQSGYHEGMKVVWTHETLGKCNVETGAEPQ